ncbi:MAG TPA: dephospho-CoA kinase [Candidatus Saccharimonadales bacterium]|nr:dephospho-CoA kinase [Candidatus Saccharimonadales bacterium]
MPFTVGLTGGIGSGKTTVAELFASNGAGIVDTDEISHQLTAPNQPAVDEIARKFGPQFVADDGSLDRMRMRNFVFTDPGARKNLEALLHPMILQESMRQIQNSTAPYVILVVPLLIESGAYRETIGRILVVDCNPETQVSRVMKRGGLNRDEVLAIIATQVSRAQRLSAADDIIYNDANLEALEKQVKALHLRYFGLGTNG